jgi:hypothetical protein
MIRIAITPAAFDAVVATLPFGSTPYEPQPNEKGERLIWWIPAWSIASGPCAGWARATATSFCGSSRWRRAKQGNKHTATGAN